MFSVFVSKKVPVNGNITFVGYASGHKSEK